MIVSRRTDHESHGGTERLEGEKESREGGGIKEDDARKDGQQ